jgi:hypothetical protein
LKSWSGRSVISSNLFPPYLEDIDDPRQQGKTEYSLPVIIWAGTSIFLTGAGSRQQFDRVCDDDSETVLDNFRALSETTVDDVPVARTVADTLERIDPDQVSRIAPQMVNTLIRNRVLERHRFLGRYYPVAIDATGWMSFDKPHCEHCLKKEHKSGKTTYYHPILEAKIVTPAGMALSIATEFIENINPYASKQDCELKGLPRILEKIRDVFPQLPICLLLDGLYANQTVFSLCKRFDFEFITTFKRGSLPSLYSEFITLKQETEDSRINIRHGDELQELAWVNKLNHEDHSVHALSCLINKPDEEPRYFAWLSSIPIGRNNVAAIANEGGRLRWKIENEGFNVQKNCEYQLEHIYSLQPTAGKNYYLLMQVAHILIQLLLHGRLSKIMKSRIREIKNFFRLIKEHLRNRSPSDIITNLNLTPAIQIRLDSS